MKRKPMRSNQSRKTFTAGAMNIHPLNTRPAPQRGGLRL